MYIHMRGGLPSVGSTMTKMYCTGYDFSGTHIPYYGAPYLVKYFMHVVGRC